MKNKHYWKVVRIEDGLLKSLNCDPAHQVTYKVGRWVTPNKSYQNKFLFVFDTREHARYAAGGRCEVYKCKVTNPDNRKVMRNGLYLYSSTSVYDGTVFVDSVKLIEKAR